MGRVRGKMAARASAAAREVTESVGKILEEKLAKFTSALEMISTSGGRVTTMGKTSYHKSYHESWKRFSVEVVVQWFSIAFSLVYPEVEDIRTLSIRFWSLFVLGPVGEFAPGIGSRVFDAKGIKLIGDLFSG